MHGPAVLVGVALRHQVVIDLAAADEDAPRLGRVDLGIRDDALERARRQVAEGFCSSPQARHFTARVRLRHAERQPLIGFVGSGLEYPSALGKTYQSACKSGPNSI